MRAECPIVVLNTTTGLPINGASVVFSYRGAAGTPTWYTAETGGTGSTGAAATDAYGRVNAWLERGAYNATISGTGITTYTEPFDCSPAKDGAVDNLWIADSGVTTAKIADANVTAIKLASDAVSQAKLQDSSVGTAELIDSNVTYAKLAAAAQNSFLKLLTQADRKVAWGTGTIPGWSANNTFAELTVNHGLGATPVVAIAVQKGGGNTGGLSASFRVLSTSSTQLTVSGFLHTPGGAFNVSAEFYWLAIA